MIFAIDVGNSHIVIGMVENGEIHNTVRFGFKLILSPIVFALWAVVFFLTMPWWLALALLVAYLPSYSIFHDGLTLFRR